MLHESTSPHFPRDVTLAPRRRISLHYLQSYSQLVYTNFGSDKRVIISIRGKDFVLVYIGQRGRKGNVR
jgi:hypothetical protein